MKKIELKQKQDDPAKIYARFTPLKESGFRIDLLVKPNGITPYPPGLDRKHCWQKMSMATQYHCFATLRKKLT